MHAKHEIGGVVVDMTAKQADRWNRGQTTSRDLRTIRVSIPLPGNHSRSITLRRATNDRLEPVVSLMLAFRTANRIGDWE